MTISISSHLAVRAIKSILVLLIASSALVAQVPQYNKLPILLGFPARIDRSASLDQIGWRFEGEVEFRRASGGEQYIDLETDERAYAAVSAKFRCKTALPDCAVAFKWRTNRVSKDVEVGAEISAPAGPGVLANAFAASGVRLRLVEKRLKLVPGKEWANVEIPFELGKDGLSSVDETFTVSLKFRTPRIKVSIDELRIVPAAKD